MSVVETFYRDFSDFKIEVKNWVLDDSGITALWGPSGSGKTSLLNGLLGLDSQAKVVWKWEGEDIAQKPIGDRQLGVVFQDLALFPHLTVRQNILFPVQKKKHIHWKEDFDKLVDFLEIAPLLDRSVRMISGGEAQRVALGRALIHRPRMLLLDEPFSSLDEGLRASARSLLNKINTELSCPILLVTHDRQDIKDLAHKVAHISQGQIIKETLSIDF